jgi:hypothetical protein
VLLNAAVSRHAWAWRAGAWLWARREQRRSWAVFALAGATAAAACGGERSDGAPPGAGHAFSGGSVLDDACVTQTFPASELPLAMYVLVDQSTSMGDPVRGGSKWSAVAGALDAFIQAPASAGTLMGFQFFGLPSSLATQGAISDSCDPADYAMPDVEIGALPGNADALRASLAAHGPSTGSPLEPALKGALEHAAAWGAKNTDAIPIVVVVTDGLPYGCGSTVDGAAAVAATGTTGSVLSGLRPSDGVPTFVIGIGGSNANLDVLAEGGGTDHPYWVDPAGNFSDAFVQALAAVRTSHRFPCSYAIPQPDGGTLDLGRVNVTYGDIIGQVPDPAACDASGGWYYAPADAPDRIILCPSTCDALGTGAGRDVEVAFGCVTQPAQPR